MDYKPLLEKFANAEASGREQAAFRDWLETLSGAAYRQVLEDYEALLLHRQVDDPYREAWLHQLLYKIEQNKAATARRPAGVLRIKRLAIAASIVALAGLGLYFYYNFNKRAAAPAVAGHIPKKDIPAPAANRAMITLANGQTVYLDSAGNGTLAEQGNMKLVKMADGQIAYQMADGSMSGGEAYNTLTNPRGSKVIDMTLSDGSHVWLNAGSSITYPVAFTGDERKVSMTGEAYFEVTHNVTASGARQSFIVEKGDMQVTVLGTHFNVNAYDDESDIKVTLLEGAVKVSLPSPSGAGPDRYREGVRPEVKLKPGQQASIHNPMAIGSSSDSYRMIIHNSSDLEQVMAWKNGRFVFRDATIEEIMRQAARWYDVQVRYEGNVKSEKFAGAVPRSANISELLKVMELTKTVTFSVEDKKIIVKPYR